MQIWEKWSLTFDDRMPIYRQIILQFKRAFVRGEIKTGDRIPSIRELSSLLKVNTNTIQRVYQEMERDELITGKRGTGYFFTEDSNMIKLTNRDLAMDSLGRFVNDMRALGLRDNEILEALKAYMKGEDDNGICS